MKLINRFLVVALIGVLAIVGCEDESITLAPSVLGLDLYPVEEGRSWTYRVDSVLIVGGGNSQITSSSFVREEITGSFVNGSGDTTYILRISESDTQDGTFGVSDVWSIEKTSSSVLRFEENLGFLKLAFPIVEGVEVENILFDPLITVDVAQQSIQPYKGWRYRVLSRGGVVTAGGEEFTNVTTVQQSNNQTEFINDLEQRLVTEQYAPNIGMIRRTMEIFDTQCGTVCRDQPWVERAEAGFSLVQTLVEYN